MPGASPKQTLPVPCLHSVLLQKSSCKSPAHSAVYPRAQQQGCHHFVRSQGCLWLEAPLGTWRKPGQFTRCQEAKYIHLALSPDAQSPLLPTWHVQTVTSPVTCYLMQPFRKLGKPDGLLTTPASPQKAPETDDKELPWLRPNALVLGNLHSWLPGWNSPHERTPARQEKGKDMALVFHPGSSPCPFSSYERRNPWLKDPQLWEWHKLLQF